MPRQGEGLLPYKGSMRTCGQPGYVFRDFCLKQGIDFIIFCLNQGIGFINFCLKQGRYLFLEDKQPACKCLKQGIKNRNSVSNRAGKSAIFVLNKVKVLGAGPQLPTQGYIEYPPDAASRKSVETQAYFITKPKTLLKRKCV